MTVLEKYQGKGVGNALLKYALEAAKSHHFHSIELLVRPYNYPAIALYEKFGFQQIGILREHVFIDGKFEDDLIYQKIL